MEHIQEFDWCAFQEDPYFVNEQELDNCVTERILRNKFHDPLISSESETEEKPHKINWDEVFAKKQAHGNSSKRHVPGMKAVAPYPKQSSLTGKQHYQCLKVLCAANQNVFEAEFIPRPTKQDHRVFEEVKNDYEKEQLEYLEWARQLWINSHCIRALRPRPSVETVYEAEFKVKAHALQSLPKYFEMAAQIPLESLSSKVDMTLDSELVKVDTSQLPQIQIPDMVTRQFNVMSLYSTPEPCTKHTCRFVLPGEKSMTILPLTEVNRELAQFAGDNNAVCIASESAVKCLVQWQSSWRLPLSVCQTIGPDGENTNVLVISNAILLNQQSSQTRAYRAFRQFLYNAFIPIKEKRRLLDYGDTFEETIAEDDGNVKENNDLLQPHGFDMDVSSDDEGDNLFIDTGDDFENDLRENVPESPVTKSQGDLEIESPSSKEVESTHDEIITNDDQLNMFSCTCKDTLFSNPPPRSFKKWKICNTTNKEQYNMIIHCPHKTRDEVNNEVLLEPIVEYQLELGATKQSEDMLKSLALSLHLRQNATVLNTRVDGLTGDLVTIEPLSLPAILQQQGGCIEQAANTLYTFINQLQGLLPGHYILEHEPRHVANAFLYAAKNTGAEYKLELNLECLPLPELDEAKGAQVPPVLGNALLPYHKCLKILPCAFTPHQHQVARAPKQRVTRQKTPPRAIRWPKKKKPKKNN